MQMVRFLLLTALFGAVPAVAQEARPVKRTGFNLLVRVGGQPSYTIYKPSRVDCGLTSFSIGEIGGDYYHGCLWPTGSPNYFLFGAGLRIAGIIGPEVAQWAGDTSGAFVFDSKGTTDHTVDVSGVWLSTVASDRSRWPAEARVPSGTAGAVYSAAAQGQVAVSDGDAWSLIKDTDLDLVNGRVHPLGIAVETRVLAWSHPRGNEDIVYLNFTIHNISAINPAAYASQRPEIRDILLHLARQYHQDVSAQFGVTLPADGYTIEPYFTDLLADPDVGFAGSNYSSVNLPLSLGFTFPAAVSPLPGYRYDATDYGSPFFSADGFFGVKVLAAPAGGNAVRLFTTTVSTSPFGGVFDARDVFQLYRYISGTLSPSAGDPACNTGDPVLTHVCYVSNTTVADVRQSLSSDGGTLRPGENANYSVALIFAAPFGTCATPCQVKPGDVGRILDPAMVAVGLNRVDSLTGYTGFTDFNGDGVPQAGEIRANTRSLLGKGQIAQAIFDAHFMAPTAPDPPEFFPIPGDGRVTLMWRPSASESLGDPYFELAHSPTRINRAGATEINPLYDPNYRHFDVEGYRVYRGHTSDPGSMTLLAQFDYAGTTMEDYTGRVNPIVTCAPELGLHAGCQAQFDSLVPGQPLSISWRAPIVNSLVQIRDGDRISLAGGATAILHADTVGGRDASACLCDTGVPFQFVDSTVRNNQDYFYAVVAFDVNSLQSAPASMESTRQVKRARPVKPGTNVVSNVTSGIELVGRGKLLDPSLPPPTWNQSTGRFSGPFPPANLWAGSLLNLVKEVQAGDRETRIRLDSLDLGQVGLNFVNGREPIPTRFYLTIVSGSDSSRMTIPVQQENLPFAVHWYDDRGGHRIPVLQSDPELAARYGGQSDTVFLNLQLPLQAVDRAGVWGLRSGGFISGANGARWFDGPSPQKNEMFDNPTAGNCENCQPVPSFNNAGHLTGVATVYQPLAYLMFDRSWRNMGASQSSARRAADYNVYWGVNGVIDSVIDVTHNVPVPFSDHAGGTWGILNTSAQGPGGFDDRPGVLTPTDWSCVEPFRSRLTQPTNVWFTCSSPAAFLLSRQALLGPIAFGAGDTSTVNPQSVRNPANLAAGPGFALYLAGTISQFELSALPANGTVWSLRDYLGSIDGFTPDLIPVDRQWTALGTELVVRVQAQHYLTSARTSDLRRVHTVPDPYYFNTSLVEGSEGVRFVNLPATAIIRIYSSSGVLLRVIDHQPTTLSGDTFWDLKNRSGQRVASGVYFYHIESGTARRAGRMTIVNFTN